MSLWVQMLGAVRGAAGSLERDASALGSRGRGMVLSEPGWNVPAFLLSEMIPKSVLFGTLKSIVYITIFFCLMQ